MMPKIIFSDIDGTLLNSQHKISSETKHVPFILVFARLPKAIIHLHKELNLKTPINCYSGALIIEVTHDSYQVILNKTMKLEFIREIYQKAKMRNLHISIFNNDDWFVKGMDDWAIQEEGIVKTTPTIIDYRELFRLWEQTKNSANKVLCMGEEGEIENLERFLTNELGRELTINHSKPTYLEIMDHSVTKTSAIQFLQERLTLKQSEIIAIGDNFNDIDMLQYANLGVAMGNAPEQVKQAANAFSI